MSAAEQHTNPILEAARDYAARGWRVIPIVAGQKRPTLSNWQNVATVDPDKIANWWGHGDRYGVGIVTGEESGIFVLDVDVADGKPGMETLELLIDEHDSDWPNRTPMAITGSGGVHWFFRWPDGGHVATNASRLGPGLDIRGNGGQVVAAPTIHPNGTPYRWAEDCSPDEVEVADAPAWLLELLTPAEPTLPTLTSPPLTPFDDGTPDDSPAAWFNQTTTWDALLTRDGWTLTQTLSNGEQRWTRPGKSGRDGISATVGHQGRDCLKVFTSSVPELDADRPYSRFGYEAAMRHHGDRSAAASHIRRTQMPRQHDDLSWAQAAAATAPPPELPTHDPVTGEVIQPDPLAHLHIVNWGDFWDRDPADQDWLIWPLIPAGRQVALYAPAKAGKSTLLLHAITTVIVGRGWLGSDQPERTPVTLYLDFEMTEDDLQERLEEFGFDRTVDLTHLHYAVLPSLDPLDTAAGAAQVVQAAEAIGAELVVIDTFGRSVAGEEDSADTVRAFYRHTGLALKQRGIAMLRTDHTGKDQAKGQRGSSAKADDVDVVWRLTRTDEGAKLECTHKRVSWVPKDIDLIRTDHDGRVGFTARQGGGRGYVPGTAELASLLDDLEVDPAATVAVAMAALKVAGQGKQKQKVSDAQRYRKAEARRAAERDLSDLVAVPENPTMTVGTVTGTAFGTNIRNRPPEPPEPNAKVQVRGAEPSPEPTGTKSSGDTGTARFFSREPSGAAQTEPHETTEDQWDIF